MHIVSVPDLEGWWRGEGPAAPPAPLAAMTSQAQASTWISLKQRSDAKQALPETAFGPKQPSARARRQVDLEVREFSSSESDWRARARISHKIRFDAIAKLFKWAGSIKTFGTKTFWRVESCKRMSS